jgi:hypothetical protein
VDEPPVYIEICGYQDLVNSQQSQRDNFDGEESCEPGFFVDLVVRFMVCLHDKIDKEEEVDERR